MATAEQILAVARSQIGTREATNGANPYGAAYGVDKVAWCAQFAWWCFRQAGADELIMQRTAYTPTLYDWYRTRGRASTTPQVGSLAFFNWPDSVNRIQHVGLVEAVEPAAIVTIEGNTAQGTAGSQSDGGGVWRRRRARNTSIVGYGHPAYTATPAATSPREGFLMALNDQQQTDLLGMVNAIYAQMSGDEDGPAPDGWGWPSKRFDGGPDLTIVDYLREVDREVNSRIGLDGRPGPDEDKLLGHVVSLRAELRALRSDVTTRLAKLAQTGGLPTVVADADPATLAAVAKAVADEQDRRARERLAAA